jgi:hypothetical protein
LELDTKDGGEDYTSKDEVNHNQQWEEQFNIDIYYS